MINLMPTLDNDISQLKGPNDKIKIVLDSTNQGLERGIGALHQMVLGWLGSRLKVSMF